MRFGICTQLSNADAVKAAGWDYVEESVQGLLKGQSAEWSPPAKASLPVTAANMLVPGSLKITGPAVDSDALKKYLAVVTDRARRVGINTLVFGSGVARMVPDGFDRSKAFDQLVAFAKSAGEAAQAHGVTIVVEPLNRGECNIVNSVAEAMTVVKAADHPAVQCLLDTYHFWLEDEPLKNLEAAMPWIKHVHVADKIGRVAPGLSGKADYRPVFDVLKRGGYAGSISFEGAAMDNFAITAPKVLAYLREAWESAC